MQRVPTSYNNTLPSALSGGWLTISKRGRLQSSAGRVMRGALARGAPYGAHMAIITDVEKLRPDLLTMSLAELERRRAEIDMAIAQKAAAEEAERRNRLIGEATDKVEAVVAGLKWLHAEGFMSAKVTEAFSRGDGQFNPGLYIRPPRSVDEILAGPRDKPKRTRRRRLPDGTLVPSKASQKS